MNYLVDCMDYRIIIVSIIVMILIGTLSKKIGLLKEEDVETLNNIVINMALPCMIFNALYTADVSLLPRLSILTVYILITSLIVGVLTYLLLNFLGWDKRKIWSLVIVVVLGNTQCRYDKGGILWYFHFNNFCCFKLYLDIDFWWRNQSGNSQDLNFPSPMVNHFGNNIQHIQHSNHLCWIHCGDLFGRGYHSPYHDFLRPVLKDWWIKESFQGGRFGFIYKIDHLSLNCIGSIVLT